MIDISKIAQLVTGQDNTDFMQAATTISELPAKVAAIEKRIEELEERHEKLTRKVEDIYFKVIDCKTGKANVQ